MSVVVVCGALSACGHAVGVGEAPPRSAPTAPARLDEGRFRTLFHEMGQLVDRAEAVGDDRTPASAEAANRLLELDDASPLRFAELEDGGQLRRTCVVSDDDTYLALSIGDQELRVFLGDGACAYDADTSSVVGDLVTGTWLKGADLMGDAEVGDVFPTITADLEELSPSETAHTQQVRLLLDAKTLGTAVAEYAFEHQAFPDVPADDLVEAVSPDDGLRLGSRTRVFAYRHGPTGFALCLVDGQGDGQGGWARWDRLGNTSHGSYASVDDLDECAAPVAADGQ